MRIHPESGAIALGHSPGRGPFVEILPLAAWPRLVQGDLDRLLDSLAAVVWMPWKHSKEVPPDLRSLALRWKHRGMLSVAGIAYPDLVPGLAQKVGIRLVWPRGMSWLDGLYQIEAAEAGAEASATVSLDEHHRRIRALLPRTLAALHAVCEGMLRHELDEPRLSALVSALGFSSRTIEEMLDILALARQQCRAAKLPGRRIHELVEGFLERFVSGDAIEHIAPAGMTNRARFSWYLSEALWTPKWIQRLAVSPFAGSPEPPKGTPFAAHGGGYLSTFAMPWAVSSGKLKAQNLTIRFTDEQLTGKLDWTAGLLTLWQQFLEWQIGQIPVEALRWFVRGQASSTGSGGTSGFVLRLSPKGQAPLASTVDCPDPPPGWDVDGGRQAAGASSLVNEAEREAAYAPGGAFRLDLPKDYPLRAWGIEALRVWLDGTAQIWVQTLSPEGPGVSFRWVPGRSLRHLVVHPQAAPAVEVTLAALWHDLRVAGEGAVPGGEPRSSGQPRRRTSGRRHVRRLPRRPLRGRRQWGTAQDREHARRRAHGVSGHLRRLPPGRRASAEARTKARGFGIVLPPDGRCTFVQSHIRGGEWGVEQAAGETTVYVRGLTTVLTLLGSARQEDE